MRGLVLALALASAAVAQPVSSPSELLQAMDDAVVRADFDVAEARARQAIARYDELSPDQLVTAHSTLGVLLHRRNAPVEARSQFEAALALDPTLTLDPVLVSPETRSFFASIRETIQIDTPIAAPEVRYLVLEDRRPDAALRSLALPGWGQFYKQDRGRGLLFAGAAAVTAGGLVVSAVQYGDARNAYLDACYDASMPPPGRTSCTEVPPGDIDADGPLYTRTDRWYRARTAFAIGAAVVWTAAVLDALITGAPEAPDQVVIEPASQGAGLSLRARF